MSCARNPKNYWYERKLKFSLESKQTIDYATTLSFCFLFFIECHFIFFTSELERQVKILQERLEKELAQKERKMTQNSQDTLKKHLNMMSCLPSKSSEFKDRIQKGLGNKKIKKEDIQLLESEINKNYEEKEKKPASKLIGLCKKKKKRREK